VLTHVNARSHTLDGGSDPPCPRINFGGCSTQWKSIGSHCCVVRYQKINNGITVPVRQRTATLPTGRCRITFISHPVNNSSPSAMRPFIKIRSPLFRPHSIQWWRPIAAHRVAWSVSLSVGRSLGLSVCLGHVREPCKNGWTDRDAVWSDESGWLKKPFY